MNLIEILVVLTIIGLLLSIALPSFIKIEDVAKKRAAEAEIKSILTAIYTYRLETGNLPESLQDLVDGGYIKQENILDPWNNPYKYSYDETRRVVEIRSAGSDKKYYTKDDVVVEENL